MASPSRSLADDIRGRTDAELTALVLARPDLARPAPADLTSLAARASTKASVQRAIDALDRGHLQVLEALVITGERASLAEVLHLLGADDAIVESHIEDLWTRALLWRGEDGLHVVRTVPDVLGGTVAGLGPPAADLRSSVRVLTPAEIEAALGQAPDAARAILDKLTWGPSVGVRPTSGTGATAIRWLLEQHLLVAVSADRVALPREVGLTLRGGRLHRALDLSAPTLTSRDVSAGIVDAVAGGAASDLLTRVDELTALWGAEPPRVLRAGGLAVRDLKLAAESLDIEPERAGFVAEVAYAAGLVVDDGEIVPVWAPAADVDEWSASEAGHRWASLALAWLATTRAPHLVGKRVADSPVNALGPDAQWPAIRGIRKEVLTELATLDPGGAADADAIRERLLWRRPLRGARLLTEAVDGVLREAEWIGVTGRGALSSAGRALIGWPPTGSGTPATATPSRPKAGARTRKTADTPADSSGRTGRTADTPADSSARTNTSSALAAMAATTSPEARTGTADEIAAAMSPHLPAPVDHILVQADLTAVAPGPLEGSLAAFMRLASEIESRGGATVHRFTPDSVRRALDAGWTASDFVDTVRRSSRTPIPQPLEYLVSDVARKHGATRVGNSAAYIRSDDEAVLDAMVATRDLATLRLRRIAPTVIVSAVDPAVLVETLRDHGFAPVVEGQDGGVVVAEPERRRARSRRSVTPPMLSPVDEAFTTTLVAGLRAAEESADERRAHEAGRAGPSIPTTDPIVTLSILRDGAADGHGVWIGVTDRLGATTRHLIHPRRVEGGRVFATDEAGRDQTFSVHRITGATLDT